jgi:uncharacterized protein (TIGR01244 family)
MKVKGKEVVRITEALAVGPQPNPEDIQQIAEEGYLTVINLRAPGEKDMEISSEEEGEIVRGNGLRYSHIPVAMDDLHEEEVDMFRHDLKTLMGPVYVHCSAGKRAAAFAMMHYAVELGLSPEAAFQKAGELGLDVQDDKMQDFMRRYISSRQPGEPGSQDEFDIEDEDRDFLE